MLNKVMLIGRLGRDPECKTTQSGKSVCSFTLATDTGYGENKKTDWHKVTVFDKAADKCAKYLRKGSSVYVEGRLSYDTYEKDGIKRTTVKIIANDVRFVGAKSDNTDAVPQQDEGYQPPMSDDTFEGYPINDEVPF
jgi:single-strand DNA-binding protein